jgi:hypothetical protein
MTPQLDERETQIVELASDLLSRLNSFDESAVDANFIFRFEPIWCGWVSKIRGMMHALLGQAGDGPLSSEDGARWLVHIQANIGVSADIRIGDQGGLYVKTNKGSYQCLDKILKNALENEIPKLLKSGDDTQYKILLMQMWGEANQTSKVIDEIERLALRFRLIPVSTELNEYSPKEIQRFWQDVVNWVIWGQDVPMFRWPKTKLVEIKIEKNHGVKRAICLLKIPNGRSEITKNMRENELIRQGVKTAKELSVIEVEKDSSRAVTFPDNRPLLWVKDERDPNKRMSRKIRVRTWAI